MSTTFCKNCGLDLVQESEKALDGTYAVVWTAPGNGWICGETGDEHVPGEPVETEPAYVNVHEAVTLGILAINTFLAPDATSAEDYAYLEAHAEEALVGLDRMRDFIIASGEDLPEWVTEPVSTEE